MRLSSRVWLLLCGGLSGFSCVGPISDWPRGGSSTGEDDKQAGSDEDRDPDPDGEDPADEAPPMSPGSKDEGDDDGESSGRDAGVRAPSMDAGAATPDAEPSDGEAGDGGAGDAQVAPDAQPPEGSTCTMISDGRAAGGCYGRYCGTPHDTFISMAEAGGACASDDERELACDGEIARVVAACAQREVLSLGLARATASCAQRADSLTSVGRACLDCYVDEIVCSMRECLVSCLDGSSATCSECRADRCGEAFLDCSGLPKPRSSAPVGPLGVDGGLPRFGSR